MASKHDYLPTSYTEQALLNHIAWYVDWGSGTLNVPNGIGVCNPDGTKIGGGAITGTVSAEITKIGGTAQTGADWSTYLANLSTVATSSGQTTGNNSLSSIDGKFGTLGQKAMSGSAPVVVASDQTSIPTRGEVILLGSYTSSAAWNLIGAATNLSTRDTEGVRGTKGVIFDGGGGGVGVYCGIETTFSAVGVPRTARNVQLRVIFSSVSGATYTTLRIRVRAGSNERTFTVPQTSLLPYWNVLYIPWEDPAYATAVNTLPGETALTRAYFEVDDTSGSTYIVNEISLCATYAPLADKYGNPITSKDEGSAIRSLDANIRSGAGQLEANASLSVTPSYKTIDICDSHVGWTPSGVTLTTVAGSQTMGTAEVKLALPGGGGTTTFSMTKAITAVNLASTGNLSIKVRMRTGSISYLNILLVYLGTDNSNKIVLQLPTAKLLVGGGQMVWEFRLDDATIFTTTGNGANFSAITFVGIEGRFSAGMGANDWYLDGIWAEWSQATIPLLGTTTKDRSQSMQPATDSGDFPVLGKGYYESPITPLSYSGLVGTLRTTKAARLLVERTRLDVAWNYSFSNTAAETTTVKAAPAAGKAIRILGFHFSAGAAQTIYLSETNSAGTKRVGIKYLAANCNTHSECNIVCTAATPLCATTSAIQPYSVDVWGDVVDV